MGSVRVPCKYSPAGGRDGVTGWMLVPIGAAAWLVAVFSFALCRVAAFGDGVSPGDVLDETRDGFSPGGLRILDGRLQSPSESALGYRRPCALAARGHLPQMSPRPILADGGVSRRPLGPVDECVGGGMYGAAFRP